MKVLLDTCAFIWASADRARLSALALEALSLPENELLLSAVSVWEIVTKHARGALILPHPPRVLIPEARALLDLASLDLDEQSALLAASLPQHHRDPFDRMLVCQALHHGLTILTPDRLIQQYGVPCLW